VIASPCSGHGFKFAPVVGEILADLATEGETSHDISRFRLDRFA
jgi:sarcosine oxidase